MQVIPVFRASIFSIQGLFFSYGSLAFVLALTFW